MQASKEHNAHIIRVMNQFSNRKASERDLIKLNADAKIDEDASPTFLPQMTEPTHAQAV